MRRDALRGISDSLARMRKEYVELAAGASARFSLMGLLDHGQFRLEDYCRQYRPNPHGPEMRKAAMEFGQRYGIWLDNAEHYISCADHLYPSATIDGLIPIGEALAVDYYLNSTMG